MPCATSPSAMPSPPAGEDAEIRDLSKVSEVFSTSQTAVALGINGAVAKIKLLRTPGSEWLM